MITVVDYGMGNMFSVANALGELGYACVVSHDVALVRAARKLVLPGVGSFREAMTHLMESGMDHAVRHSVADGGYLLGICLGMQLLAEGGAEDASPDAPTPGLGLIPGTVTQLPGAPQLKIPHVGFNQVRQVRAHPLFDGVEDQSDFYFVHSFRFESTRESLVGTTVHGVEFASVVAQGRIAGTQFHPEKSQANGLRVLRNFCRM